MGIINKRPCHEAGLITDYISSRLKGHEAAKPEVKYKIHQTILNEYEKLLNNEDALSSITDRLLAETAKLSNFDVNMSFIANSINRFAEEMTALSETNMAMVEETTASMDQVNDSIKTQTATLNRINEQSKNLIAVNGESIMQLEGINRIKNDVIKDANDMSSKIETLVGMINKVNEIVEGVEGIAGQTNMLALNAAIEAARAGDAGRGFAVVADEIRKLADDTKTQLEGMRSFMEAIHASASEGRKSMSNTISSTLEMSDRIEVVTQSIHENVKSLEETVNSVDGLSTAMIGIASSADEINSAMRNASQETQDIVSMTENIVRQSKDAADSAKAVSLIDDGLSQLTREMNGLLAGGIHAMSKEKFLQHIGSAKAAHKEWMAKLNRMVENRKEEPIQTNGNKCAFGHFYNILDIGYESIRNEWSEVGIAHKELHKRGSAVLEAIRDGRKAESEKILAEVRSLSEKIFEKLSVIEAKMSEPGSD